MYAAVKAAALVMAFETGANWMEVVSKVWDEDDFGLFSMVISFWFVGRSIEKYNKS
jgi:hypothetical protein